MLAQSAPLPPPLDMGGAKRNFPFFRENLKRHEVSLIAFGSPDEEKLFRDQFGNKCAHIEFIDRRRPRIVNGLEKVWMFLTGRSSLNQIYRRKFQKAIDRLVSRERFDLIHCCVPTFGTYRLPAGIPVISDTHNVEHAIFHRAYKESKNILLKAMFFVEYVNGKRFELNQCKKFDAMIATTEFDKQAFLKELPEKKIYVIPNGVDNSFFEKLDVPKEQKSIVFVGVLNWYANIHALEYFLEKIFPRILAVEPKAKLYIVGAYPPRKIIDLASENIIVTGFVKDVREHAARCEVFVIPILIGSGIRGKALEAMAMKIPMVSTTLGCTGLHLQHNESVLFADTPEEFADAVVHLLRHPEEGRRLAENAFGIVKQNHDWEKKGLELDHVYHSVAKISQTEFAGRPALAGGGVQ
jgi:glycosyltransferase involved in cell wall biosynthesis